MKKDQPLTTLHRQWDEQNTRQEPVRDRTLTTCQSCKRIAHRKGLGEESMLDRIEDQVYVDVLPLSAPFTLA